MRLDKMLSNMGFGTRKEIKKFSKMGIICVDGKTVKDTSQHINPEKQQIEFDGERVEYREHVYLIMNKPQGVISATEDLVEKTVVDLLEYDYRHFHVFPVGRLDKDTEGLLLLTNDGKLAHELLSPRKQVAKTYYAEIEGFVTEEDARRFEQGVTLDDGYETLPAQLNIKESGPRSKIELTIYEGKFHQVKRMFQAVGKQVVFLKRIQMGPLELDPALTLGEYRELSEQELLLLKG
ncbi:16S rRNA pseudouridine(516) synthase [Ammoniphilus oxalaticus]|uniref:Pseudouridine synthase n=1 Tax=Ammoniphilus oxalaticus TaxID=66863 RepID=A0A419SEV5_9BACL|nr:pseudouridine synthase [Ammoniphilus oxalaticus]RKD21859.1 16S rRNA pseudouridine(516) synthase [Ammoniphilus oxalaticus]